MERPSIPREEFRERRQRFAAALSDKGLDAGVVWSLGGATFDWHGDVAYLTDHHAMVPHLAVTEAFSAPGFCAVIVPSEGDSVLVTSTLDDTDGRIEVEEAIQSRHVPQEVARILRERGLASDRVGFVGRDTILAVHERMLRDSLGAVELVPCDEILESMRAVKSDAELAMVRYAAEVGLRWMETSLSAIQPGVTEAEIVAIGLDRLVRDGGVQYDIAVATGANSHNYWGSSGVPHWNVERRLEPGEMVHIDLWGPVNGYYTDFARSTVVGGDPNEAQLEVLNASIEVIEAIVAEVRPGVPVGDLYSTGVDWLVDAGFVSSSGEDQRGVNFTEMFPSFGHGYGIALEKPYLTADEPTILEPNMVIAIEAVVGRPGVGASNFEHNVIVNADGCEVLTRNSPSRPWESG